jgi:crotonobetainyl-CoA:carnitine CoA-transferase CaiB-like acyl-CoA transferase
MYELLDGIRILDLTTTFLGPYATQLLGDAGADVVKIETLDGDVGRTPRPGRSPKMGAGFLNANRNKRSIALDLKSAEGRAIVLRLAQTADAVVHNMRPSAAARLGLAYEDFSLVRPGIVYCFAPGFGQDGPYADRPAYDDIIQAMSGLAHLNRDSLGAPRFVPSIVADKIVGLHLALALTSGLIRRLKTGKGCAVEVPMFETMAGFLMVEHLAGASFVPGEDGAGSEAKASESGPGYERLLAPNRRPFATRDGHIAVMPYTSRQWARFMACIGRTDLLEQDWVTDPAKRSAHADALYAVIAETAAIRGTEEFLALLGQNDIPCGRVNALDEVLTEPHLAAVGLFEEIAHPSEGTLRQARSPFCVAGSERRADRPAPRLGADGEAILREAGFSAAEIADVTARRVVGGSGD